MNTILWIGPTDSARPVREALGDAGFEMREFTSAEAALAATKKTHVSVVVIYSDFDDPRDTMATLQMSLPEAQTLVATGVALPRHIKLALRGGATQILDLGGGSVSALVVPVIRAFERHRRVLHQRDLLLRLRELNEKFLRTTINLEKRNIELERQFTNDDAAEASKGTNRVLVIDDEESILQLFEIVLEDRGYEVITASTGEQGIEELVKQPFDLVVTDKNLPGISGLEVLDKIKQLRPDTDVVMITGFGSKDSAIGALNRGAIAFLEKPFDDIDVVADKLDQLITDRQERLEKRRYLHMIKERNRDFLEQYRSIRADLDHWLQEEFGSPELSKQPIALEEATKK